MNFDELTGLMESFNKDFEDSISWLERPAESVEDEIARATIISTLNRLRNGMLSASDCITVMAAMLTLCTPTQALSDFIEFSMSDPDSAENMSVILAMISTFVEE